MAGVANRKVMSTLSINEQLLTNSTIDQDIINVHISPIVIASTITFTVGLVHVTLQTIYFT